MDKPYVVSEDIYLPMKPWAIQHGFVLPTKEFFYELREEFSNYIRRIFSNFELVSEDEVSRGLAGLVTESSLSVVSLDCVYSTLRAN